MVSLLLQIAIACLFGWIAMTVTEKLARDHTIAALVGVLVGLLVFFSFEATNLCR